MDKIILTLIVWQITAVDKIKARREAGQGTLEYVGMIAVAAIIILAVFAAAKEAKLGEILTKAVTDIKTMK